MVFAGPTQSSFFALARFFWFPENKIVVDQAANIKGMLGRTGRPGITSIEGTRGTISRWTTRNWFGDGEVRYCSDKSLMDGAIADEIYPIINSKENQSEELVKFSECRWRKGWHYIMDGKTVGRNEYMGTDDITAIYCIFK